MLLEEFTIGIEFELSDKKCRCTDVGSRAVIAIKLDKDDLTYYHGPPYAVEEIVLDEYDLEACVKL